MTRRKVLIKIFLFNWSYSSDRFKAYSQPISKTKYIYEDMSQYNEVCPFIIPLSLMVTSYKLYASNRKYKDENYWPLMK